MIFSLYQHGLVDWRYILEQQSSEKVTLSLTNHILDQDREYGYDIINDQLQNKAYVNKDNKKRKQIISMNNYLIDFKKQWIWQKKKELPLGSQFSPSQSMASHYISLLFMMLCSSAVWLDPFPSFSKCECGNSFNVEHALSCRKGGFPSLRHNEIRDTLCSLRYAVKYVLNLIYSL